MITSILTCIKRKISRQPWLIGLLLMCCCDGFAQLRYFREPTISLDQQTVRPILAASQDSIANDTLFQVLSKEGYPVCYYRKIRTSVCFDNKCRLLKCVLYWNITGRYLGFELPPGEFLSKAEHKEFTVQEYNRLSALLADGLSPLRDLSYAELAPTPKTGGVGLDVDAVSSATAKNVLDYVVEGAAYTTYKMWHVVYGPTQDDVNRLTEKQLTPDLILKILDSPDLNDRLWGFSHIKGFVKITPRLRDKLVAEIGGNDYNVAERAVNAFDAENMRSDTIQNLLMNCFDKSSYAVKKLILNRFREAPSLSPEVTKRFAAAMGALNGELVINILDLLTKNKTSTVEVGRLVARLLTNGNSYVAQKAYRFLENAAFDDRQVQEAMAKYRAVR